MSECSPRVLTIFNEALDCPSAEERSAYLDRACEGDADLRAEIESLVRAHGEAGAFLEGQARDQRTASARPPIAPEGPGTVVGPYRLLEQLGEGGFGVVFTAEQTHPVRRKVALKVLKPGMDTRQVVARFEAERQALAVMDHPNIATVFDGGATPSGRPYFVMELVKGVSVTEFCDQNRLPPRQRLELFITACHAVQHAHQKGIIHRDLKPSNILAAMQDGRPLLKVIDFGIAKALAQDLTDHTLVTASTQMLGTPLYASPEQAARSVLDIDTRSDIYSLGVLLYELLTGTTPFDKERFKTAGFDEIRRILREEEPPTPSTRLSQSKESLSSVSALRQMEPAKLTKLVRGELDWIVMKALEKDRERRYETASALAMDVERYLADEPVQACPPSAWYRLRKFVRRYKGPALAATVVFLALLAGAIGTGFGLYRAEKERRLAEKNERMALASAQTERKAKQSAQAREAELEAVLDFVEKRVLAAARPEGHEGGLGHDVTLRRAVEAALPYIDDSFADQPLIEARLRMKIGASFIYLGAPQLAAQQFETAGRLRSNLLGPDHPDTVSSMHSLATSFHDLGRHEDALRLREEVLAARRAQLPPEHPSTLVAMNNVANSYYQLGRHAEALELRERTLALRKAKSGPNHPDTLMAMNNLANSYAAVGRQAEALRLREETLALRRAKLGPDHADTLQSMANLATSYSALGRHPEALALQEETLTLLKKKLGPEHLLTVTVMSALASTYFNLDRHDEAVRLNEEALAKRKALRGVDHPDTLWSMFRLAMSYDAVGRHLEALELYEETLRRRKAVLGPEHPDTLWTMNNLAGTYRHLGRHADACDLDEKTLALRTATLGPEHPDTFSSMHNLASRYFWLGRYAEALSLQEQVLAARTARLGASHADTLLSMNNLAWFLAICPQPELRAPARALVLATQAVEAAPTRGLFWNTLGAARYRCGAWQGAVAALEKSVEFNQGRDVFDWFFLAMSQWQLGDGEQARRCFDQAVAAARMRLSVDPLFPHIRAEAEELLGIDEENLHRGER
jgi:serine/threonine protein kinase/tetratricopeptide (TPR) repeat protein